MSFGGLQLYNLKALPFTYDPYVVIDLADKVYNYVTVFVFVSINFHPDNQLFQVAGTGDRTTDLLITKPALDL